MFKKKVELGYAPIKYQPGKQSGREYKSKCLEYGFKLPAGCELSDKTRLLQISKPGNIVDLEGMLPSKVRVTVSYLPFDGSFKDIDVEKVGMAMVQSINETKKDDRRAVFYGCVDFLGKKCAHSAIELNQNGVNNINEFFTYMAPYCQIQFAFTYSYESMSEFETLKQAFHTL